jgi:hypothetical protein
MKLLFVIFVSTLALCATDPQTQTGTQKATPRQEKAAQTLTIPEGAAQSPDGDYHFTDAQGKKWLYRNTPFGVSKREDTGAATNATTSAATSAETRAKQVAASAAGMKATEDGDTVHFEKLGPFGVWKWDKKKSELDDTEKAALKQQTDSKVVAKQD